MALRAILRRRRAAGRFAVGFHVATHHTLPHNMPGLAAAARRLSAGGQEDSDDDEDKYIAKVPSYVTYEWEGVPKSR